MGGVSCVRRHSADGDHTHALVAEQSHCFPDNLVALSGPIRAKLTVPSMAQWDCEEMRALNAVLTCPTLCGYISASRSGCAWWRSCWWPAASLSATKPSDNGRASSASRLPTRSVAAFRELVTNGIWTRSCSKLPG